MPQGRLTVLFAPAHTRVDDSEGGSEYYWSYKLIERLAADHGVACIALTIQPRIEHDVPGVRFVSVAPGGSLPVGSMDSLRFHLRCYAAARRILADGQRIDLIHHMLPFGFRSTFNVLALRRRRGDPPIVVGPLQAPLSYTDADEGQVAVRDLTGRGMGAASMGRYKRTTPPLSTLVTMPVLSALSARTLRHAAARVATSERAARLYRAYTGLDKFDIIPPGVDTDAFTPATTHRANFESGRRGEPIRLVAVGYLIHRKAFDVLIKATAELVASQLPVHLYLVGEGPARPELETLAHQLGIVDYVSFVGHVPHNSIARVYRDADIFCSTSRSEGFSTVCLEALSCGLPVVATPTGGFREVLDRHDVGRLVPFDAVGPLAQALADLVKRDDARAALGQRAREVAVREYDWRIISNRYLSVYNRALQRDSTAVKGTAQ